MSVRQTARHLRAVPYADALPAPLAFRTETLEPDTLYPLHRHDWGEFIYAYTGVIEVQMADRHLMAPPLSGLWLPAGVAHTGLNRMACVHSSFYVARELCGGLPSQPCAVAVSALARALLDHLRALGGHLPREAAQGRALQVLLDEVRAAPVVGSYLPGSEDPLLAPVLRALEADPADRRGVAELARLVHASERTLLRRAQQELGMPLAEWRQRLRIVRALPALRAGGKVQAVALELGYASASSFITAFRRHMGVTPQAWRAAGG